MTSKIKLHKRYTRDNCFVIQEVWDRAYLTDFKGNKNPYFPPKVNYLNDGVVEFWQYDKSIDWFIDNLLNKNIQDPTFIDTVIKDHLTILEELEKFQNKKICKNITELKSLISLMERGTRTFLAFWHSANDARTPAEIRNKVIKIRDKDSFYDDLDSIIRKSIETIHPHTKNLSISILIKELLSPPNEKVLQQRFKNSVMVVDDILKIGSLEDFILKDNRFVLNIEKVKNSKELEGQIAFKGYAKGKVRIIKRKIDVENLKEGEILVSPMTTPDFVMAMKKSSAIVTDEGGLTCHAAIVSREMGKPCIVGTKNATKIFKDGDIVEVDADKGIVRKLNSLCGLNMLQEG